MQVQRPNKTIYNINNIDIIDSMTIHWRTEVLFNIVFRDKLNVKMRFIFLITFIEVQFILLVVARLDLR